MNRIALAHVIVGCTKVALVVLFAVWCLSRLPLRAFVVLSPGVLLGLGLLLAGMFASGALRGERKRGLLAVVGTAALALGILILGYAVFVVFFNAFIDEVCWH